MALMLSTKESAKRLGLDPSRIRQICIASHQNDENPIGEYDEIFGRFWVLSEEDIERIRSTPDMRRREYKSA